MQRIADLRPRIDNLDEADVIFRDLVQIETRLAVEKARLNKTLVDAKARHDTRTQDLRDQSQSLRGRLAAFIDSARHLFVKPRKRRTEFGAYGLQTVNAVDITDEPALMLALLERGYEDCYAVVRTPIKAAILARIDSGETLPGVRRLEGDTAVIKPDPALLKEAASQIE